MLMSPLRIEKQAFGTVFLSALFGLSLMAHAGSVENQEAGEQDVQAQSESEFQQSEEVLKEENELPTLDGSITMEERIRLHRDLDQYSRSIDSTHIVIENHRRGMRERLQERFSGADKDNDGSISREEATESLPQIARHFSQVDGNGDGVVTLNELAVVQARMERRRTVTAKPEVPEGSNTVKSEVQEVDMIKPKSKELSASQKKAL